MSARRLRYELLLAAILAVDVLLLAFAGRSLARRGMGGEVGVAPLLGLGLGLLALNRLLLAYEQWERRGKLVSGALALLGISLLMGQAAPEAAGGPLAGPGAWLQALVAPLRRVDEPVPLTVIALLGGALWLRSVMVAQNPAGLESALLHLRNATALLVLLVVEATTRGVRLPASDTFTFMGAGLLSIALARAHGVAHESEGGLLVLPFNRRWLAMLGGAIGATLLAALLLTTLFSLQGFVWLGQLLAPLFGLLRVLFGLLVLALGALLFPLIEWLLRDVQAVELPATPTPAATVGPVAEAYPAPAAVAGGSLLLDAVLVGALLLMLLLALYVVRHLLRQRGPRTAADDVTLEGAYGEAGRGAQGGGHWLRQLAGRLRGAPRRELGVNSVRDLYRNLQHFGELHGFPRPPDDTPYEYLAPLHARYPQLRDDFRALTDAYVAAHYGERTFTKEELRGLQAAWQRIARAALPPAPPPEG